MGSEGGTRVEEGGECRRGVSWMGEDVYGGGGGVFFFFNDTATTEIYTLSLHDAFPISPAWRQSRRAGDWYLACPLQLHLACLITDL